MKEILNESYDESRGIIDCYDIWGEKKIQKRSLSPQSSMESDEFSKEIFDSCYNDCQLFADKSI